MGYTNNKPHVNFKINKEMDYWTLKEFLTFDFGDTFSENILTLNPKLKEARVLQEVDKITSFNDYVDQVYKEKGKELNETQNDIQKAWDSVEQKFLKITKDLFNGHTWPKGSYVGFLSIFNCNPRFLNQKTFQVYYKHPEGPVYVCAHEMLHFIFYDYIEKHSQLVVNFNESLIWSISEIFNIVILETPEFANITGNHNPQPYKEHAMKITDFRELWKKSKNVDQFIKDSTKILR